MHPTQLAIRRPAMIRFTALATLATVFLALSAVSAPAHAQRGPAYQAPQVAAQSYVVVGPVEVLWGTQWWQAQILDTRPGSFLIRYVGYSSMWDEWVGVDRIRGVVPARDVRLTLNPRRPDSRVTRPSLRDRRPAPHTTRALPRHTVQAGAQVEILWGGSWYPGTVLRIADGRALVSYTGWSSSWDEWVTFDRLR